jgi:hypothetical protein
MSTVDFFAIANNERGIITLKHVCLQTTNVKCYLVLEVLGPIVLPAQMRPKRKEKKTETLLELNYNNETFIVGIINVILHFQ